MQVGDKVTTIHGEELEVLGVDVQFVKKNKEPVFNEDGTPKTRVLVLAESGDQKCWFPEDKLQKENE